MSAERRTIRDKSPKPGRYVLLIRHAARAREWRQREEDQPVKGWRPIEDWVTYETEFPLVDSKPGLSRTCGLTGQLCDELETKNIWVSDILCSKHRVACQTAKIIAKVIELRKRKNRYDVPTVWFSPDSVLTPEKEPDLPPRDDDQTAELIRKVLEFGKGKVNKVITEDGSNRLVKGDSEDRSTAANGGHVNGKEERNHEDTGKDSRNLHPSIELRKKSDENLAIILIGHQPQLTMIARALLDKSLQGKSWKKPWHKLRKIFPNNSLPANVLPLGNSEIACIELGDNPRLLWLLTEKPNDLLIELKAKIASKYDVAKFFLGALVVGTGLTLGEAIWKLPEPIDKILAGCGAFAALVSLGFTAATLFSYDRLLMPQEFWLGDGNGRKSHRWSPVRRLRGTHMEGKPPRWTVSRPPSQAHLILFYEMVHTWTHFFIPAIVSAFAALGLLVVAMADKSITEVSAVEPIPIQWIPATLLGIAVLAFAIGFIVFYLWKPRLGFDD